MNTKVKIVFILLAVFILGIFTGAMINRTLIQQRIRNTFAMRNPMIFPRLFMEIVRPDPEQEKQIRKILDAHAEKIKNIRDDYFRQMGSAWEALKKDLDAVLTPQQKKRLEEAPGPMRHFPMRPRRPGDWRNGPHRRNDWPKPPPDEPPGEHIPGPFSF